MEAECGPGLWSGRRLPPGLAAAAIPLRPAGRRLAKVTRSPVLGLNGGASPHLHCPQRCGYGSPAVGRLYRRSPDVADVDRLLEKGLGLQRVDLAQIVRGIGR